MIIIFIGACTIKYVLDKNTFILLGLDYNESTQTIKNPERGWYSFVACLVNDNYTDADIFIERLHTLHDEGDTLVIVLFNLVNYRSEEISENGLKYIDRVIANVNRAGLKAIVRFEYDWDGKGEQMEPERIETVLRHMEQVGPVLNEHKKAIYLMQGIFVGNYGEMHGSKFLGQEDFMTLLNTFLDVTDDSLFLSVRTPAYWRNFANSGEPLSSFTSFPYARIGLFNDGLCSSDTDLGTYSDGSSADNVYTEKWIRQEELNFQARLCQYVPNGGEVALLSEYNDLDEITKTFPLMHISYLNRVYNSEVLDKWKDTIYKGKDSKDAYNGLDGYKYIEDHLGYRYVLREVTVPKKSYSTRKTVIHLKIENTGFANLYSVKQVNLILRNKESKELLSFPAGVDVRNLLSGTVSDIDITIPTKEIMEGTYQMYLKISDDGGSSIRLANDNIYYEELQANAIGSLEIREFTLKHLWDIQ